MIKRLSEKLKNDLHLKEIIKGSSVAVFLRFTGLFLGYIFTLLITRNYGAKAMGVFSLSLVILEIGTVFGKLGTDSAILKFVPEYLAKGKTRTVLSTYKKILKVAMVTSVISAGIFFLFSQQIAIFVFKKPNLTQALKIASISIIPFALLSLHREAFRGLKKIKEYMLLQQPGLFITASIVIAIFILNGFLEDTAPVISYLVALTVVCIVAVFFWNKKLKENLKTANKGESLPLKYILSVSLPMMMSSSLAVVMNIADTAILGIYRPENEVGIYTVAIKLATLSAIGLFAINAIAVPKIVECWGKKDLNTLTKIARQSATLTFFSAFPIIFIFFLMPDFILNFFGQEFGHGATALKILLMAQGINAFFGSNDNIVKMTGHQVFHQNTIIAATILNIGLNFTLIPLYGLKGAALATAISILFWNIVFAFKVRKILGKWVFCNPFSI